jgi:hypothetical protein
MELLRNLRFELPPPQISDTFDGENDGHFFGQRHVETLSLYFAGVAQGRFTPPKKTQGRP